jgi:septal ring factor EnvC (AmiA/AmiB activator)
MPYPNKPVLESLFIFTLFLFPITKAASGEPPQQVGQLQTQIIEENEKIAKLTSDQEKTAITISALQTNLDIVNQKISDLKNKQDQLHKQLVETAAGLQRSANGHGRGGEK